METSKEELQSLRERGFRVLSARPAAAESVMAYASLADLLGDVDEAAFARLPYPQLHAIDRVLLRAEGTEPTDQRAVAAGLLSVVEGLAGETPILLAVDDLQWLDPSSARALAFVARRLSAPVGVLGAVRTGPDDGSPASWLQCLLLKGSSGFGCVRWPLVLCMPWCPSGLGGPFRGRRWCTSRRSREAIRSMPLELARANRGWRDGCRRVVAGHARRVWCGPGSASSTTTFTRCCLRWRVQACRRWSCWRASRAPTPQGLPSSWRMQSARASPGSMATGCVSPIRLLAKGVYTDSAPAPRRAMHRRWAEIVTEPEQAARHLALAATSGDPRHVGVPRRGRRDGAPARRARGGGRAG